MLLVAIVTGAKAADETLLTYTTTSTAPTAKTDIAAGNGKIQAGSAFDPNGDNHGWKLDGDGASSKATSKYVQAILATGKTFQVGDVISLTGYSSTTASETAPQGFTLCTDAKNTQVAHAVVTSTKNISASYTVTTGSSLIGESSVYIVRYFPSGASKGSSAYFTSVTITRPGSTDPALSVVPTTAESFTYIVDNGPSAAQEFTVTLENSSKAVSATLSSENYEMSKTSDGTYASTAITDLENGSKVYVRLKAGLEKADDYNGTLTFANADVEDDVVINLSGSVTGQTYTVTYDLNGGSGDAPTQDPVEAGTQITLPAAASKDFYTFAGWLCDADNVVYDAEALYTMTATPTTFTAQWTGPTYSSTLDFAAVTLAEATGTTSIADFLAGGNIVASSLGSGSEWETQTGVNKSGFWGYKLKNSGATVKFLAQSGKRVTITLGSIADAITLKKNAVSTQVSANKGDTKMTVISFDTEEDVLVEITTSKANTVTLNKIAIEDAAAATNVHVGTTGFATIGLPYATTLPTGVTAYAINSASGTTATVSDAIAAGTTIPANRGYIIVGTAGQDYSFAEIANDTKQFDTGSNILKATGSSVLNATAEGDFYYFAIIDSTNKKVGFKKCSATATLAANKAYLPGTGLSSNALNLEFADATAVEAVAETKAEVVAPVKVIKNGQLFIGNYTVAGARVK